MAAPAIDTAEAVVVSGDSGSLSSFDGSRRDDEGDLGSVDDDQDDEPTSAFIRVGFARRPAAH